MREILSFSEMDGYCVRGVRGARIGNDGAVVVRTGSVTDLLFSVIMLLTGGCNAVRFSKQGVLFVLGPGRMLQGFVWTKRYIRNDATF